jgi:hypothetical protein
MSWKSLGVLVAIQRGATSEKCSEFLDKFRTREFISRSIKHHNIFFRRRSSLAGFVLSLRAAR